MSLFSSIQLAGNSLQANQIGLQVVGQNIANANTPGYIREEVTLTPAPTQAQGGLLLGSGVQVDGVVQQIDNLLESRLRGAQGDTASGSTQQNTYKQLEGILGELGVNGLNTKLTGFVSSINDVLNQPENASVRSLAVLKGKGLTDTINQLASKIDAARTALNKQVVSSADDVNRLTTKVANLNLSIVQAEGGNLSHSDAVGLRDQRNAALSDLAKLIDIHTEEQPSGAVNVYVGGDYLVNDGQARSVKAVSADDRGLSVSHLELSATNSPLEISSGQVSGLIRSRDKILGGFQDKLNDFSKTLAFEFNKVYSSGQGLSGYQQVASERGVSNPAAALDAAGLPFTPVNGSFQVQVTSKTTGLTKTSNISVDLNGLDHDTSLTDLAAQLSAVSGLSASITPAGKLQIKSTSDDKSVAFANDTSGVLAALGINTFFSGSDAGHLGINADVLADSGKFAASRGGVGADSANAVELAGFLDRKLDSQNGATITEVHDRIIGEVTQASSAAGAVADGYKTFQDALQGQSLATSGVSLDEEAIKMISYQRSFQASAKFISTLNDLLQLLVSL